MATTDAPSFPADYRVVGNEPLTIGSAFSADSVEVQKLKDAGNDLLDEAKTHIGLKNQQGLNRAKIIHLAALKYCMAPILEIYRDSFNSVYPPDEKPTGFHDYETVIERQFIRENLDYCVNTLASCTPEKMNREQYDTLVDYIDTALMALPEETAEPLKEMLEYTKPHIKGKDVLQAACAKKGLVGLGGTGMQYALNKGKKQLITGALMTVAANGVSSYYDGPMADVMQQTLDTAIQFAQTDPVKAFAVLAATSAALNGMKATIGTIHFAKDVSGIKFGRYQNELADLCDRVGGTSKKREQLAETVTDYHKATYTTYSSPEGLLPEAEERKPGWVEKIRNGMIPPSGPSAAPMPSGGIRR
jgi:hypothetical protein